MSEEIDSLIERKEAELSQIRSHMEKLREQFTKETVSFASEWYRKTAKEYHQILRSHLKPDARKNCLHESQR